jgi:hypothetical protein
MRRCLLERRHVAYRDGAQFPKIVLGRVMRRAAHHPEKFHERYCIFDSRRQFEMSAGERSVFGDQSFVPQLDPPPHEVEMVLLNSNGGHRITDKSNVAPIFCRKGGSYKKRIDMDTVENDARRKTFVSKGYANNARFPGAHGGHRIKEVCNSTEPLVDGPYQGVGSCLAVTNRDSNSARSEGLHKSRKYPFRCQASPWTIQPRRAPEPIQIIPCRGQYTVAPMNPRARPTDERSFEMKAQYSIGAVY